MAENNPDTPSAAAWLVDGSRFSKEDLVCFSGILGPSESDRYRRFARSARQRQFLLGRMLLRFAIADFLSLPASAVAMEEQPAGPPRLILPYPVDAQPAFSLSHSGNWVACAVSRETFLGLDIEVVNPERDLTGISRSVFRQDEVAWLEQQPSGSRVAAFYHLWSLREALFKLLSNAGSADKFPGMLDAEHGVACHGIGWYSHNFSNSSFSCILCSAQPLPWSDRPRLNEVSPAMLLAAIVPACAKREFDGGQTAP